MTDTSLLEKAGPAARVNIPTPVADSRITEVHEALDAETFQGAGLTPAKDATPVAISNKPPKPADVEWNQQRFQEFEQEKIRKELKNAA